MSIDMNTLISQMIMFFVILGCGFIGAKLGLLKAEVIHGLSSLLMGVICPLMLISVSSAGGKCMGYCKICNSLCTDYISAAYRSWIPDRNVIAFPGR